MSYNMDTTRNTRLWSDDDARHPLLASNHVTWYATVPDPQHPGDTSTVWQIRVSPLDGRPGETLGNVGAGMVLSVSHVVWNDFQSNVTYAHSFSSDRTFSVNALGLHQGSQLPIYALCDHTLYYYAWRAGETREVSLA